MKKTADKQTNKKSFDRAKAASVLIIIVATFAVYAASVGNGFVYDDHELILNNRLITDFRYLPQAFTTSLWSFKGMVSNTYRPVLHLIFLIERAAFGVSPWGYHLTAVALHAANAVTVFLIASLFAFNGAGQAGQAGIDGLSKGARVLRFPVKRGFPGYFPPLLAGLVFALHPVNSEVVSWVSAITELTYTLFFLLSLYFFMRFRAGQGRAFYALSILCFPVALLSKETAIMLPALIAAYDLSGEGVSFLRRWKGYILYILLAVLYMALRTISVGGLLHHRQISLSVRELAINIFPLIFKYAWKLVLPIGLNAIYVMEYTASLAEPKAIAGVLAAVVFILALALSLRKRQAFIGLLLIALPLLPVLYIPALSNAAFADRYLYLPSAGFAMLISFAIGPIFASSKARKARAVIMPLFAAVLVLYSAGSFKRSAVWKDDLTLWQDTIVKSPSSKYAHYNLALAYREKGEIDKAIADFEEAIRLDPAYEDAHYNLAWVYDYAGDHDRAIAHYRDTIRLNPASADAYFNIGLIYRKEGLLSESAGEFRNALRIRPGYAEAEKELAGVMGRGGRETN
ncbi:MAG: tetratricopeptide repeat protein [Deltaproteobacteria bacterium]|nr:tetratricopeptide repeat protein [Deltaproteobacteria bacterium]